MGSPANEPERSSDEGPQHEVRLDGFFLAQTPITQAQWKVVAGWEKVELVGGSTPNGRVDPHGMGWRGRCGRGRSCLSPVLRRYLGSLRGTVTNPHFADEVWGILAQQRVEKRMVSEVGSDVGMPLELRLMMGFPPAELGRSNP